MATWTMENTEGFTQAQLDELNAAQAVIESNNPDVDPKSISDRLNNAWNEECQTSQALVKAVNF